MAQMQMTGTTHPMIAGTVSFDAHRHREPSRVALATRSLSAVDRLAGDAQRAALRGHFEAFPPVAGSPCPAGQ